MYLFYYDVYMCACVCACVRTPGWVATPLPMMQYCELTVLSSMIKAWSRSEYIANFTLHLMQEMPPFLSHHCNFPRFKYIHSCTEKC